MIKPLTIIRKIVAEAITGNYSIIHVPSIVTYYVVATINAYFDSASYKVVPIKVTIAISLVYQPNITIEARWWSWSR